MPKLSIQVIPLLASRVKFAGSTRPSNVPSKTVMITREAAEILVARGTHDWMGNGTKTIVELKQQRGGPRVWKKRDSVDPDTGARTSVMQMVTI